MLLYLQCDNHPYPRDIVIKQNDHFITICSDCFAEKSRKDLRLIGVKRNSQLCQVFTIFTNYVEKKMEEWGDSLTKFGFEAVFEKKVNQQNVRLLGSDWTKLNQIALNSVNEYKNLMKSNRECVTTSLDLNLMYHPEFLKDIFNMTLQSWSLSAGVILDNFKQQVREIDPDKLLFDFTIKKSLADQIDKQKTLLVKQYEKDIIVSSEKILMKTKEVSFSDEPPKRLSDIPGVIDIDSEEDLVPDIFGSPLVIKKVDSFIYHKQKQQSNKKIEQDPVLRKNKLRKSKLIDEDDYNEWKDKFLSNLNQLQHLKKQNEALKSANTSITNQKLSITEDNEILRRKYERLLHDSKQKLTSGKKSNENVDPNSELLLNIVELEVQINDCRHDISLFAACINELIKNGKIKREAISKTLQALRTVNLHT